MNAPSHDWQTWAALAVVALTIVIFTIGIIRRRHKKANSPGCSSTCGCAKSALTARKPSPPPHP